MTNPFTHIASMIDERSRKHAGDAVLGMFLELGTITVTGLKLDSFKHEIQDYLVAEYLTLPDIFATETTSAAGTGPHTHTVTVNTPAQLKALKAGDRVLVAPVNGGQDFVVVARVVNG